MDRSDSSRVTRLLAEVARCIERMDRTLTLPDDELFRRAESVSGWSVAEQLYHIAAAAGRMLTAAERTMDREKPAREGGRPSVAGRAVMLAGRIPRGRGRAPSAVHPPDDLRREQLENTIGWCRRVHHRLAGRTDEIATATWRAEHFVFGWLNAIQWLRIVAIHSDHHFLIVDDILAADAADH